MKRAIVLGLIPVMAVSLMGQSGGARRGGTQPAVTAEDLRGLREMLQAQQQQIEELRQELQRRDQQWQQAIAELRRTQESAGRAQTQAQAATTAAAEQNETVHQLQATLAGVQGAITNSAANTQGEQKRIAAAEGLLGRFRLSGDVRVRYENLLQDLSADRHRARVRLRLGVEGKLNEDFSGGLFLASGDLSDPVSSNQTMTGFLTRKPVGFDRGWITYNPQRWKWLSLSGGKMPFAWTRTGLTFDGDINPEGFSQKLSFDVEGGSPLRNVSVTGFQMLLNESGGGADSYALGWQAAGRVQLGERVTITPSVAIINWANENAIAAATRNGTTAVLTPPATAPGTSNIVTSPGTLGGNRMTNATVNGGAEFASGFLYSDYILDTQVKTPWRRFPLRLLLNFEKNLNAATNNDSAGWAEITLGQTRNPRDLQFGYSFAKIEQDALIAAFNESDMRAPTNLLQHRVFAMYQLLPNTTAVTTLWVGRTLNADLPNAAKPSGLPAGEPEPWLKRMQLDLIYKF